MASASTVLLPQHKMTHKSSSAINFRPEIFGENFAMVIYTHRCIYNHGTFWGKNIVL